MQEPAATPGLQLPGFPLIASPLFRRFDEEGRFGDHAELARALHRHGFVVLDLGRERVAALAQRIRHDLECHFNLEAWREAHHQGGLRLQDAWRQSLAVRELALLPEVLTVLATCWGREPFAFQTLNFPVGTQQHFHSDAVHFHSEPAGFMCGVWVALEDVHGDAGPLEYYPGSQRLPYVQARDVGYRQQPGVTADQTMFHAYWQAAVACQSLERAEFTPRLGQALIWTANLLHGGAPVRDHRRTRWSQVTHYFFEGCRYYTPLLSDWPDGAVAWRQPLDVRTGQPHRPAAPAAQLTAIEQAGLFQHQWYAEQHGLSGTPRELLLDYLNQSGPRLRWPNPWFDPEHYLEHSPDVRQAGVDPLWHYLAHGWRERRPTLNGAAGADVFSVEQRQRWLEPFFWPEWYLEQLPPGSCEPAEALDHLLRIGVMAARNPNPLFSAEHYLAEAPDLRDLPIFPLVHYLLHGALEGRSCHWLVDPALLPTPSPTGAPPLAEALQRYLEGEPQRFNDFHTLEPPLPGADRHQRMEQLARYVAAHPREQHPLLEQALGGEDDLPELRWREARQRLTPEQAAAATAVQAIAFYLPQFHRIPENDAWWGEGFTDWRNALAAHPFYRGQLQPHRPHPDLGCYDLADPQVLRRQAAMARRYGISAFCFYHYWFDGRLLLETPLRHWLADPTIDLPLCLCWANETWSRRWDGRPHELLIAQTYPPGYTRELAASLLPALRDPRYLRWNGRPVLLVYRPGDLPDAAAFAAELRDALALAGIPELELLAVWSFDRCDPRSIGFDGAVQFAPLQVPTPNLAQEPQLDVRVGSAAEPRIYAYPEAIRHGLAEAERPRPFPLYSGLCPSWDNTARRGDDSVSWIGATPGRFERWLRLARWRTQAALARGELRAPALFINAWNEWGEGCHLEPDQYWGYRWLEAARAGLHPLPALRPGSPALRQRLARSSQPLLVDGLFWQSGYHGAGSYGQAVLRALIDRLEARQSGGAAQRLWLALDPERPLDPSLREQLEASAIPLLAVRSCDEIAAVVNAGVFARFFAPAIVAYTGYRYGECSGGEFLLRDGPTEVIGTLHDARDWLLACSSGAISALRHRCGYQRPELGLDADALEGMLRKLLRAPGWHRAITVSEASAAQLAPLAPPWRELRVLAPPPAPAPSPAPLPLLLAASLAERPYLVLLHAQRPEKNAGLAIRAFEALRRRAAPADPLLEWRLVLVGAADPNQLGLALEPEGQQGCVLTPVLDPGALEMLLRCCRGLVYPGWHEGYGLPPVEALALGIPSLVAASGSLPEVLGDAAIRVDPFDLSALQQGLVQLMTSPPAAAVLAARHRHLAALRRCDSHRLLQLLL